MYETKVKVAAGALAFASAMGAQVIASAPSGAKPARLAAEPRCTAVAPRHFNYNVSGGYANFAWNVNNDCVIRVKVLCDYADGSRQWQYGEWTDGTSTVWDCGFGGDRVRVEHEIK